MYRRAILTYVGTIVLPTVGLLWLGLQSFERQRQALATMTGEKLSAEIEARSRAAAMTALNSGNHPIAKHFFKLNHGKVVRPALYSPPPDPTPPEYLEAENQEFAHNRPDLALNSYRRLFAQHRQESLTLSRIARCLSKLGREDEARSTWRTLATTYPDERDLSHRPFGIVAAIEAGDTAGLYEKIISGRWELAADQAEYFLKQLDPKQTPAYVGQFRFARELNEQFKPQGALRENEIYSYAFGNEQIFYRLDGPDSIQGFAVDANWAKRLRPQLERDLGITESARQDLFVYGGAIAIVLVILSAGVVLLLRDISRDSRTNQLRSDFVNSVSHELKTPITLIRLYSETLLRHAGFREEERSDFYRIIMRQSERLGRLVDQILTFGRVEKGDATFHLQEGDLAPAIVRIVEDYREFVERAGFSLERSLPESAPPVRFDEAALSQAVINLLDNAVKYSGQPREIAVCLDVRGGNVTFEVEDHGAGIALAEQQKIFERFYRIPDHSGKGGYGLGLFMVKHIMEAHGGRAEVESEPGRGSRFRLVFPVVNG